MYILYILLQQTARQMYVQIILDIHPHPHKMVCLSTFMFAFHSLSRRICTSPSPSAFLSLPCGAEGGRPRSLPDADRGGAERALFGVLGEGGPPQTVGDSRMVS